MTGKRAEPYLRLEGLTTISHALPSHRLTYLSLKCLGAVPHSAQATNRQLASPSVPRNFRSGFGRTYGGESICLGELPSLQKYAQKQRRYEPAMVDDAEEPS
jgi:L-cystine uptake protein TcyP (sodium:dicarboxylate symporter family)